MKKLTKYLQQLDTLHSWQSKFTKLTKGGYNVLLTVEPRMDGEGFPRGSLGVPELEFSATYPTEKSSPLLEYYASLIKLYKDDVEDEEAVELAREIIEFEHWMFTNTTTQIEKARGPPMNTMRLEELNKLTRMDWNKTFTTIIGPGRFRKSYSETVINDVKYVKNFRKMMDSKDEAFLSEYLKLAVVRQSCFFLGQECRDLHFKMASSVRKFESEQEYKERTCYNTLDKHLQELLFKVGDVDSSDYNEDETRVFTERLAGKMDSMVSKLTWMDDETKKEVFERIRDMFRIKYKCYWRLNSYLDTEYSEAPHINSRGNVDIFDYFTGFIQFHKKRQSLLMTELRLWPLSLFASHPLWYEPDVQFYVPFFFMKGLFNADDLPDQIRFGFYGSLLTHEMTHQFDALAANFTDKYGWDEKRIWSKDSRENFDKQMQCLIDAYDGQQVGSGKINGTFTLDENLADLIGVNAAFESWKNNTSSRLFNASEIPDPLKDLMDDRLFFLAYANSHCSRDAEQMPVELQLGLKTPHKLRVNLPLAHSDHFAQAFKCAPGSKMNPAKKCPFK